MCTVSTCSNIDLAHKRNPGLSGHLKGDGQAGSYCLLMHGGYFKTLGEKKHASSRQKFMKHKQPGGHEYNFLTSLLHLCAVFTHSSNVHDQFLLVFITLALQTTQLTKPLLTSTWPELFWEN